MSASDEDVGMVRQRADGRQAVGRARARAHPPRALGHVKVGQHFLADALQDLRATP